MAPRCKLQTVFGEALGLLTERAEEIQHHVPPFVRYLADGRDDLFEIGVALAQIGERFRRAFERNRRNQHDPQGDFREIVEGFLISGPKLLVSFRENLHTPELNEDDGRSRLAQVVGKRREIEVARLGVDGVAFPPEIAKAGGGMRESEEGLQMSGMLRGGDVRAPDESDDIVGLKLDALGGMSTNHRGHNQGEGSGSRACTRQNPKASVSGSWTVPEVFGKSIHVGESRFVVN
jgi:hypothetical protein